MRPRFGQRVFKNGSRRREEADFGAKNISASLPSKAATALATILELTQVGGQPGKFAAQPVHLLIPITSIMGGVTKKALGSRDRFRHSRLNCFRSDSPNRPDSTSTGR